MLQLLRYGVWAFFRLLLSARYRVRVHGLKELRHLKGPTLILPNHPGYIDPPLVVTALWPVLHPRPMLYEGNFRTPMLHALMKLLNAVEMPDLDRASVRAREQAEKAIATVVEGLRRGETHIMWPAGHVQRDGTERLGAARALTDILAAIPEANVVLVRTRGVWGSMYSHAYTGEAPPVVAGILKGLGLLLANVFVFLPRRTVDITVELLDRSKLPELRREKINPWFEAWYNAGGPEKPTFVPYHFLFGPRTYEFPKPKGAGGEDLAKVKPETKTAVAQILSDKLRRPLTESEQVPELPLDQLGLDSLDRMEVTLAVENQFGFSAAESPATLGQLWLLAQGLVERAPQRPAPPEWFQANAGGPVEIKEDTIAAAFVWRALANPKDVAVADDLAGVLTYERLLIGAMTMAHRFARVPDTNVGLMLPSSVACDVALFGLCLAGKLPVVLNWTTGPANLAHAARTMNLTHVVTSRQFVDRTGIEVAGTQYLFLEDLRQEVGRWELLRTLLQVRVLPASVSRSVPRPSPDQPAVVLFTSGSEKAPKAVPLTHANLLTDQRAGIRALEVTRRDSLLGFLPAFHSFGLSVTTLLPLLGGIRLVHHPDPTDATGLTRKIAAYRPTLLIGTPTFVSYIVERAEPGQLDSLRLILVGAEKCPTALMERVAKVAPKASLLEGYGITECSPIVSVNTPTANRPGTVGKPLPAVEVSVVDLETDQVLPVGRLGMLLVSGPTIFPGYIGHDGPSPFQERDGKRWYVTGDLAEIDTDGFIHFSGRLKRFLKAGGEMISLPALEEPFARLYPPTKEGPRVAIDGIETEGGRRIVLFTTEPIELRDANARLLAEGFRGVMRLDEVRRVDKIPVLGTGKTDYKVLHAQIATPQTAGAVV